LRESAAARRQKPSRSPILLRNLLFGRERILLNF
jgi:hypothetical protein